VSTPPTTPPAQLASLDGSIMPAVVTCQAAWQRRFHFERGDLVAFLIDQENPKHLYAGLYLSAEVVSMTDGGRS